MVSTVSVALPLDSEAVNVGDVVSTVSVALVSAVSVALPLDSEAVNVGDVVSTVSVAFVSAVWVALPLDSEAVNVGDVVLATKVGSKDDGSTEGLGLGGEVGSELGTGVVGTSVG